MSILKYFSVILVGLAATVCQAEIAIEVPFPQEPPENPSTPSGATPSEIELKVEPLRLAIDLVDGSRIIGVPEIKSITVQTSYAQMDIPLEKIVTIEIKDDHETASFALVNGDKLKGVLNLEPMELETIFGHVSVDVQHVTSVRVHARGLVKQGLVLHYSFDRDEGDKVTDGSGQKNDGKVYGAIWTTKGKVGGACQFDGSDDYIAHSTGSMGVDGSPYSVSVWFKTSSARTLQFLFGGDSASAYPKNAGDMYVYGEKRSVCFGANDRDQRVGSAKDSIRSETWYHVVGVATGKERCLYLDGELVGSDLKQPNDAQWHTKRLIGRRYTPGTYFNGSIDEVMIFNRALSKEEVQAIYSSQK